MSLGDRLSALENKSGEFIEQNSGPIDVRCPRCGKIASLPQGCKDYVCTDCYTRKEFDPDLLKDSSMSFTGMRTGRFIRKQPQSTQKDVTRDTFIDIRNGI